MHGIEENNEPAQTEQYVSEEANSPLINPEQSEQGTKGENFKDIQSFLKHVGLEQYIEIFIYNH